MDDVFKKLGLSLAECNSDIRLKYGKLNSLNSTRIDTPTDKSRGLTALSGNIILEEI
jgi:hypothetical protein